MSDPRRRLALASLLAAPLLLGSAAARATPEVQTLLKAADEFRLAPGVSQVDSNVESYKDGKLDKERRYLVYLKDERRSLVISRSPVERGQKILMLGDDFWLVLPTSQRPVRITPLQKLLGEASTGDIATMTWAGDYDGAQVGDAEAEGVPCTRLDLTAQRRGVTYARMELYLAKADGRPVRADLYVASDKMAKRAVFEMEKTGGRTLVSAMTLLDQIQTSRKTVIHYLTRSNRTVPDEFYNPAFLTRGELPE
jgi:Outer membrane lipoprotein-sorting protein